MSIYDEKQIHSISEKAETDPAFIENLKTDWTGRIIQWAEAQQAVRAAVLTSTFAIPNGQTDLLSDYDVILAVTDIMPFFEDRKWLEAFGQVLVMYRDPLYEYYGHLKFGNVVQFEGGLKIDFTLWPVEILKQIAAAPELPEEFDAGYRVLLDKDGLADGLKPPTYRGYIPKPPGEAEYLTRLECFFHNMTYVAKYLWRDDMMAAKFIMEGARQEDLRPLLEWIFEIEHGWTVKPGAYGRWMKRNLQRPDLWAELEATYTGMGIEENWAALEVMFALVRKAGLEVAEKLGFSYPEVWEQKTREHIRNIKNLEHREFETKQLS